MWEDPLERGARRGAGFGAGRGGKVGEEAEMDVSSVESEAGVSSVEGADAFLEGRCFLSNETFPMWMGSVSMTSGDFRHTWFISRTKKNVGWWNRL